MAKPQIHLEHGTSKIGNKQRYAFDTVLIGVGVGETDKFKNNFTEREKRTSSSSEIQS